MNYYRIFQLTDNYITYQTSKAPGTELCYNLIYLLLLISKAGKWQQKQQDEKKKKKKTTKFSHVDTLPKRRFSSMLHMNLTFCAAQSS